MREDNTAYLRNSYGAMMHLDQSWRDSACADRLTYSILVPLLTLGDLALDAWKLRTASALATDAFTQSSFLKDSPPFQSLVYGRLLIVTSPPNIDIPPSL
jgi:hypothetical protein